MNNIIDELVNIREKSFQGYTEYQLINNLSETSLHMSKKESDFKLDLLFLEHDYEFEACFCGYEDSNYNFKLLSEHEYLKCDYNKELFNGNDSFDYTPFLKPILKFEENLGKEKVNLINGSLGKFHYLDEIKKLFLLNGFLGIHLCLDNMGSKIRQLDILMNDEVFIFGNEHDCEALNIYVL